MDNRLATGQIMTAWPSARVLVVTAHSDEHLRLAASRARAAMFPRTMLNIRGWLAI